MPEPHGRGIEPNPHAQEPEKEQTPEEAVTELVQYLERHGWEVKREVFFNNLPEDWSAREDVQNAAEKSLIFHVCETHEGAVDRIINECQLSPEKINSAMRKALIETLTNGYFGLAAERIFDAHKDALDNDFLTSDEFFDAARTGVRKMRTGGHFDDPRANKVIEKYLQNPATDAWFKSHP